MLKNWRKTAAAFLAVGFVLFFASLGAPAAYEICGPNEYTHAKECVPHHLGPYLVIWIAGEIDSHNGIITALATVAVALFTVILARVGQQTEKTARRQIDLQNTQHFLTHRPHLVVRNIRAEQSDPGDPIKIAFEVINVGSSEAEILASAFETHLTTDYSQISPVVVGDPPDNFLGHRTLLVNAVWRERPFETGGFWRAEHFHQYLTDEAGYFLFGKIIYRDGNGQNRRIGIVRRLDVGSRRFRPLPVTDPDYEYDD